MPTISLHILLVMSVVHNNVELAAHKLEFYLAGATCVVFREYFCGHFHGLLRSSPLDVNDTIRLQFCFLLFCQSWDDQLLREIRIYGHAYDSDDLCTKDREMLSSQCRSILDELLAECA